MDIFLLFNFVLFIISIMNGADLDENDEIVLERFLNIQKKRIMGTLTKAATKIAVIVTIYDRLIFRSFDDFRF